jgi:flavin reductase (DIM6/NTAB) family NADH-FMN oxidoreductase RutF
MKKEIDVFEYASEILKAVKKGVLLTTKTDEKVNAMTISWGTLGIEWGKPIFTTFVRQSRFTKKQLDKSMEFTINIPYGDFDKKILGICGSESGHLVDKIEKLNLTLEPPVAVSAPAIKELPLTLECKVIYIQKQVEDAMTEEYQKACYPQEVDGSFHGTNKDFHTAYYAEIVSAYIIE